MKLINGDCLKVLPEIPDKSVDLILCDLPYGTTASSWDSIIDSNKLWEEYKRILKDKGNVILFASGQFIPRVINSNLEWFKYSIIWVKRNSTNFVHAKNRPMTLHEQILVFSPNPMGHFSQLGEKRMIYNPQGLIEINKEMKNGKGNFGNLAGKRPSHTDNYIRQYTNYPTDVLTQFPELPTRKKIHTNQKPSNLLEYLIKTFSNNGATVLDNCMGSGSTGYACVKTGRDFIGIEIKDDYFNKARDFINQAYIKESIGCKWLGKHGDCWYFMPDSKVPCNGFGKCKYYEEGEGVHS